MNRFFRRENGRSGDIFVAAVSGKKDGVSVEGHACGMGSRWRREDHDAVKHDKCFSDWKVSLRIDFSCNPVLAPDFS